MKCPKCGNIINEKEEICPDCNYNLSNSDNKQYEYVEMETIFLITDPAVLPIAKSLLEEAKIRYYAAGENVQNLFTIGQIGTGFNVATGPIRLQVPKNDVKEAKQILRDLIFDKNN